MIKTPRTIRPMTKDRTLNCERSMMWIKVYQNEAQSQDSATRSLLARVF